MRKISKTMAVMGLLAPMGANALGIGDIKLHSALNQLLNAEIPLVVSGAESISEVRVTLAPPDAFSRAGIERQHALTKLRFSPIQKPDGSYVIKISSQDVIREPFLNFLVEVNWPQGRLFREFTVLLDPPATFGETTLTAPFLPETNRSANSYDRIAAEPTTSPQRVSRATARPSDEARISGSEFGPVRRNETLWNIAKLVNRDPSITQEQMVIALYQSNPQAFYQNSVNALKAGETLRIPDRETILRISPQEAKAQFYEQARAGKLSARSEGKPQPENTKTTPVAEQQGQLKLESPPDSKTENTVPGSKEDGSKSKGDIALEVADTVKQENEEIRSRLAQLEQQLSGMQRMLNLKDEQIASLRTQQPAHEELSGETAAANPPVSQQTPATAELPPTAESPKETARTSETAPPAAEPPKQQPAPAAQKPQPAQAQPAEEAGFLSELLDEPFYLAMGVGGALLVVLLAWLAVRRRTAMIEEMESILAASEMRMPQKSPTPLVVDETPSEQIATTTKSSFLSEFSSSDFDALGGGADEVDPIAEADVYLAYGRYKQAEELIRSAIEQYPERDECKLKLLEIHYATENKQAFESYAREIFEQNKEPDPEFWDKVVEMGRELCPESPLFSNVGFADLSTGDNAFVGVELQGGLTDSINLDEDLIADLKRFEQANRSPTAEPEAVPEQVSPLRIVEAASLSPANKVDELGDSLNLAALEFDLSSLNNDESAEKAVISEPDFEFDNLIQFETNKQSKTNVATAPAHPQRDKTLDDILIELGAKSPSIPQVSEGASQSEKRAKDEFDFDLELISPPEKAPQVNDETVLEKIEERYADLTDLDEQETKLDLAKAYVDMGDEAAAREILEDVLQKGNEAQKTEARTRRDKLMKN